MSRVAFGILCILLILFILSNSSFLNLVAVNAEDQFRVAGANSLVKATSDRRTSSSVPTATNIR